MEYEELMEKVTEDKKIAEIFMKNPRTQEVVMCAGCGEYNTPLVAYYNIKCRKCSAEFKAAPNKDIQQAYYKTIIKKLKHKNSLIIYMDAKWDKAEEILEDVAGDFKKLEDTGMHVKAYPEDGVYKEYKIEKARCSACGICFNCLKCLSCGEVFSQQSECPNCSGKKIVKFYFNKVKHDKKNKKYVCPKCEHDNIMFTMFDGKMTKCPSCKTDKINLGNRKMYFIIVLKRYGGAVLK